MFLVYPEFSTILFMLNWTSYILTEYREAFRKIFL